MATIAARVGGSKATLYNHFPSKEDLFAAVIREVCEGQAALMATLDPGDEVIVPAVSWSTTYYPLHQYGLKLKFVDIDLHTLNYDLAQLEQAMRTLMQLTVPGSRSVGRERRVPWRCI